MPEYPLARETAKILDNAPLISAESGAFPGILRRLCMQYKSEVGSAMNEKKALLLQLTYTNSCVHDPYIVLLLFLIEKVVPL